MLGVHHLRHPLQGADDHGLLPFLQVFELPDKTFLQQSGRGFQFVEAGVGDKGQHFALVLLGTLPPHVLFLFQSVDNTGHGGLAQADLVGQFTNGHGSLVAQGLHDHQLRRGEGGGFDQLF